MTSILAQNISGLWFTAGQVWAIIGAIFAGVGAMWFGLLMVFRYVLANKDASHANQLHLQELRHEVARLKDDHAESKAADRRFLDKLDKIQEAISDLAQKLAAMSPRGGGHGGGGH